MANTSAPLSETAVAAMAAGMLDDFTITSLDDSSPMGRFLAREFGYVRDEVLQMYPWHFAQKRAVLTVLADEPAFGWDYAYQLPSDCIRLHPLRASGSIDGEEIPHEVESGQVLTDQNTSLKVRYTFRQTNMAKWRPLAARVLAARLALYAATRVTGKEMYYQKSLTEYNRILGEATHVDSLERGTPERVLSTPYSSEDVFSVRGLT